LRFIYYYAEFRYAERLYAECRYTDSRGSVYFAHKLIPALPTNVGQGQTCMRVTNTLAYYAKAYIIFLL
jgi:hypothetical protein